MLRFFFCICCCIFYLLQNTHFLFAQDISRVKENISLLTSPQMHGRGATFYGDTIASFFLAKQFQKYKLQSFSQNYYQPFTYNINTFPGKVSLKVKGDELKIGKDFILHPSSGAGKNRVSSILLDTSIFNNPKVLRKFLKIDLTTKALLFETQFIKKAELSNSKLNAKLYTAGAWIELVDGKLTASLSPQQYPFPYFQLKKDLYKNKKKADILFYVEAELKENYNSRNVIGYLPASAPSDSFIVVTAHYDHLGHMGKEAYFPGANDNASGTSMILELMAHYASSNNSRPYNLVFISFSAEEAGLIGSRFYTENPLFPLSKIKFLINLDLMGTGDEGMMVVNGALHTKQFEQLQEINTRKNYLPAIKKRGKAANSDHYFFSENGVPCFFFYTMGGITAYHDVYDIAATLPLTKYKEVFSLIVDFIDGM